MPEHASFTELWERMSSEEQARFNQYVKNPHVIQKLLENDTKSLELWWEKNPGISELEISDDVDIPLLSIKIKFNTGHLYMLMKFMYNPCANIRFSYCYVFRLRVGELYDEIAETCDILFGICPPFYKKQTEFPASTEDVLGEIFLKV